MRRKARTTKRERKVEAHLDNIEKKFSPEAISVAKLRATFDAFKGNLPDVHRRVLDMHTNTLIRGDRLVFNLDTGSNISAVMSPKTRQHVAKSRTSIFTKLFPK